MNTVLHILTIAECAVQWSSGLEWREVGLEISAMMIRKKRAPQLHGGAYPKLAMVKLGQSHDSGSEGVCGRMNET